MSKKDPNRTERRGRVCHVCHGAGTTYCCDTYAYAMACLEEPLELSVLPKFPGTGLEMNYCPFCGRSLSRVSKGLKGVDE